MKLNAGCGGDIRVGWVNLDLSDAPGVDIVADLALPLPIEDKTYDRVSCLSTLEHILNWEYTMKEFYRILKMGGILEVAVPKGFRPCAYHVRFFETYTFNKFIAGVEEPGACIQAKEDAVFELIERKIRCLHPFAWHIKRYLSRDVPRYFIFGRKKEIYLKLKKVKI